MRVSLSTLPLTFGLVVGLFKNTILYLPRGGPGAAVPTAPERFGTGAEVQLLERPWFAGRSHKTVDGTLQAVFRKSGGNAVAHRFRHTLAMASDWRAGNAN